MNIARIIVPILQVVILNLVLLNCPNVNLFYKLLLIRKCALALFIHGFTNSYAQLYNLIVIVESFAIDGIIIAQMGILNPVGIWTITAIFLFTLSKYFRTLNRRNYADPLVWLMYIMGQFAITIAQIIILLEFK